MTRTEAIDLLDNLIGMVEDNHESDYDTALKMGIKALAQEPCEDAISRQALLDDFGISEKTRKWGGDHSGYNTMMLYEIQDVIESQPLVKPQEPKTGQYEKHIDHTDCIWYGSDSGCPVTCSQYRDGWNDAMDYIFKNGNGYQPYRHDG